ncbi:hypothetical protein F751_0884 [Auxenochlorella protothecoides]|uniref:ditrans,polycis-polyprenyl diphosphate synthase [(2E,6E)-farnesyldiphosphate specific] n=1 Tax=Auxenochlorella protothecoides TaxID=3075 RepID=A0A087SHZ2_AUXPR|nr:hypothetical protein F751_0884 [Auxenochlorella protothecoides]KFM25346.1 hypothetical protein F751_0884 [Auxenochlorella protothecoides]
MYPALPLKHLAYYVLCLWIWVRQTALEWRDRAKQALRSHAPVLFARLGGLVPTRGVSPRPPTVLGLIVTDFSPQTHFQALARILTWAHFQGYKAVLVYDPSGSLKEQRAALESQPQLATLPGTLNIQAGWGGPPLDTVPGVQESVTSHETRVVLLAAEDSEWPLDAAAAGCGAEAKAESANAAPDTPPRTHSDMLAQALAAPDRLRRRLVTAAGPAAGLDPDFLVVFGPVLGLGGFPAWAARSCEIYFGGPLCQASGSKLQSILRRHARTKLRHGR